MMGRRLRKQPCSVRILVLFLVSTLPVCSMAFAGLMSGIYQRRGFQWWGLPSPQQSSQVDREDLSDRPSSLMWSFTSSSSSSRLQQQSPSKVRMRASASRRGSSVNNDRSSKSRRQATRNDSTNRRGSTSRTSAASLPQAPKKSLKSGKASSRRIAKASAKNGVGASSNSSPSSRNDGNVRDAAAATETARGRQPPRPPPWQVLSSKDAKKNVAREIQRRELIRQGLKAPHEPIRLDEMTGFVVDDAVKEDGNAATLLSSSLLNDLDRQFLKWRPSPLSSSAAAATIGLRMVGSYLDTNANMIPPLGVPEVAFLGRSNVGKSSLLNRLVANVAGIASSETAIARVGKTPGATASVNLYALFDVKKTKKGGVVRDVLGLCDLPGFGYAKLSKQVQESVQFAAERYLSKRRQLALGILLVDIRRTPSDDDRAVLAAMYDLGVPILVVATKVDKVDSEHRRELCLETIRNGLGLPANQPLAVSSATGGGCRHLWKIILEACENAVEEFGSKYESISDRRATGSPVEVEADDHEFFEPDDEDEIVYDQGHDWIYEEYDSDFSERALDDGR